MITPGDGRSASDLDALADRLWSARTERRLLDVEAVTDGGGWSMSEAYAVQALLTQRRLDRGERQVGWKLGYTSLAMRQQMGVDQPNFGPLTDSMMLANGAAVPATVTQPRVEPEIAVRLGRDLTADPSPADVAASVEQAIACLEIVDSVWLGYRFRIEHNTADGSSAAYVVLGDEIERGDLSSVAVTLRRHGDEVATATGAAASGDPLLGVAWLARRLAERGERLRAGHIVITGGLTAAVPLDPGDVIEASFDGDVIVACRR